MDSGKSLKNVKEKRSLFKWKFSQFLLVAALCLLWIPWQHYFAHIANFGYFKGKFFLHIFKDTLAQTVGSYLFKQRVSEPIVLSIIVALTVLLIFGFIVINRKLKVLRNSLSSKLNK